MGFKKVDLVELDFSEAEEFVNSKVFELLPDVGVGDRVALKAHTGEILYLAEKTFKDQYRKIEGPYYQKAETIKAIPNPLNRPFVMKTPWSVTFVGKDCWIAEREGGGRYPISREEFSNTYLRALT